MLLCVGTWPYAAAQEDAAVQFFAGIDNSTLDIDVVRADSLLPSTNVSVVLKVDTEGQELRRVIYAVVEYNRAMWCRREGQPWESCDPVRSKSAAMEVYDWLTTAGYELSALGLGRLDRAGFYALVHEPTPKDTWADEDELFGMRLRAKMEAEQIVAAHREAERRKTDAQGVRQAHLDQVRFQVGDIVLLYHPQVPKGVSSKLFTHWKGPYQIMEQMGPLNYKIRGRGKVQIVNVRRLIKYDPFLLEDESVEEALKRMKEDFKEVPPIQKEDTLEEEDAYRAPVTEKEETEKESKEDSNRKSAAGTQSKAPIVRGDATHPSFKILIQPVPLVHDIIHKDIPLWLSDL
eukprot:g57024.t1